MLRIVMLLAGLLGGCTGFACDADSEIVDIDRVLTQGDLEAMGAAEGATCEEICVWIYEEGTDWLASEPTVCDLELEPQPGADPETEVGTLFCTLEGFEGLCL